MYQFCYIFLARRAQPLKPTGKSSRDLYIMRRRIKASNRWNRREDATRKRERGQKMHAYSDAMHTYRMSGHAEPCVDRAIRCYFFPKCWFLSCARAFVYVCACVCVRIYVENLEKKKNTEINTATTGILIASPPLPLQQLLPSTTATPLHNCALCTIIIV